jgi:hypothetical protein
MIEKAMMDGISKARSILRAMSWLRVVTLATVGFPFIIDSAAAGTYKLVKGQRFALCREYDANLKSFSELTATTTEWPLNPRFKNSSKLHWEPVDAMKNMEVIKTIYSFQTDPTERKTAAQLAEAWHKDEIKVTQWVRSGEATLERTEVTLDGTKLIVYRYKHPTEVWGRELGTLFKPAYWYIFYDPSTNNPLPSYRFIAGSQFQEADSFLYEGRFYMIKHYTGETTIEEPGYRRGEFGIVPVCEFKYSESGDAQ